MKTARVPTGYWTLETLQAEALKYTTRSEFQKGTLSAYKAATRQNLLNAICCHMVEVQKPRGYWTLETLQAEALKYTTRSEFQKGNGSAYGAAGRMNLRNAICGHMTEIKKPDGYWSVEKLRDEALKYSSRQEFQQKNGAAYKAAGIMKCRDIICLHMVELKKPRGFWNADNLFAEALKYENKVDFVEKSPSAFLTATRKNLIDQICAHMVPGKLPNGHWSNKNNCADEALKYTNRRAFSLENSSAYHGADANGWLDEICAHMDFNPSSDSDMIYLWRAVGQVFDGLNVYKFGVTSARLDDRRIVEVARFAKFEFEVILLVNIKGAASVLESELLKLGASPGFIGFNGASEFRALTDSELQTAKSLIEKHQNLTQDSILRKNG